MQPSCTCTKGLRPLDSNSGYCLSWKTSMVSADAGRDAKVWLRAVVLLARRQSRQPGCFASGESQGIIRRGKSIFPLGCSRAFLGQKPSNFPSPQRGRRSLYAYPNKVISPIAGPGSSGPWRRSGGAQPPAFPFVRFENRP